MKGAEKLSTLNSRYTDVSGKLSDELLNRRPDYVMLTIYRKQLAQMDKTIRRMQIQKDFIPAASTNL